MASVHSHKTESDKAPGVQRRGTSEKMDARSFDKSPKKQGNSHRRISAQPSALSVFAAGEVRSIWLFHIIRLTKSGFSKDFTQGESYNVKYPHIHRLSTAEST